MISTLKHYILLQRPFLSRRDDGTMATTYNDMCHAYADIMPMAARESYYALGLHVNATHKVKMRFMSGIVPGMRFTYMDRVFHIRSVMNEKEDNRFLMMVCEEENK